MQYPRMKIRRLPIALFGVMVALVTNAHAGAIETENEDLSLRWDTNVKYSLAGRLKSYDPAVTANPNGDDGSRNFSKGLISNRADLFTEVDAIWQNKFGARISGAAYYDSIYNKQNSNLGFAGGAFPNQLTVPANQFTEATRNLHGRKAEVLDAFVFGKFTVDDLGA